MYEKYTVLFVDDEDYILNSLRRGLFDETYNCLFATSGKGAIEILEKKDVHVIVTDMKMPEMNGLELLKIVTEKWPSIIKVVLSGYTQLPQILATINQVDIFRFITKPWALSDLDAVIKKCLDLYIIKDENLHYQKLLETKNKSYQNILKRIDDVINDAKKSSEVLGLCGKAIYKFEKKYDFKDRIKFNQVFLLQEVVFDIISQAVIDEKKVYSLNKLEKICKELIISKYPKIPLTQDIETDTAINFQIKKSIFEATIKIILLVFKEEFQINGLIVKISYENKFKLSIIFPNVQIDDSSDNDKITALAIKIDFMKIIMLEFLRTNPMNFQILKLKGSLLIGFTVEEAAIQ